MRGDRGAGRVAAASRSPAAAQIRASIRCASPVRAGRFSRSPSSRSQAEIRRAASVRPTATYASASGMSRRLRTAPPAWPRSHELLDTAGRHQDASSLANEHLELARKAGPPVTLGAALRAHAAAVGRDHAEQFLAEAISLLEPTPARYELALTLADFGARLRRTGRRGDARAPLRRALDLAQRTGAMPLAQRIRRELLAAGARPRRTALTGLDALTSAERRVAGLATDGLYPTGRSPSTLSSPSPPSKPTCGMPSTNLASPPGQACPRN